ncbi:putative ribonuclease [Caenibius tardaugens NBRC 16725]|uniref:Ribonuclease E n=1 Tax=Caenibius tardaugens NBRC 16725 TaxID=1219035 RepID=U2YI64_9SPHN|nr:ribonuclease E/G [Caenibius tardaugens]AZI38002.1 Rne/Rng family ribonuclease [Caenibius tardaugens NBRC 16725]GAD47975.1 putative ribonuclease [Caenibius tardaugens NBRC 16725]
MTTRMLIDARHPEETRVAVLKGNRIEEFDFESADKKQIKGNIYLAKVTRVEPSLQAAFVDFGGNRHGFLAFSEIHPDYYQIPREDREALLAEEAAAAEEEARLRAAEEDGADDDDDDYGENGLLADDLLGDDGVEEIDTSEKDDVATIEGGIVEEDDSSNGAEADESGSHTDADNGEGHDDRGRGRRRGRRQGRARSKEVEELRAKRMALRRRYKIQDVIQRRQVLLVQVVKEERGNKGAALTTYLSLAGRYTVLMPNSSHGGGISRKISSSTDRKRLKQIVSELKLPRSMGCIIRTAGLQRTKTEIKRDFDYLARLWDEIRENTLSSSAPAMIHSDSDLIKRAIRDIYNRDIEDVVVEGEEGYKAARQFMKLLMPSHARRVKQYADPVPLFQRYGAEDQLTAMYDPVVQLKSGGYLVINPTEALVSIDINSGRSTKEHGIEATALSTNLEAAKEIARQLRLRDMAGLVVIDFIDMEYSSNIRKVERAMKDALKHDRARIQVGRISGFGLMEMSRQRLRTGVLEATTRSCPHCDGTGLVRTASSAGLSALRLIEDEAAKGKGTIITLYASTEAAIYLLNQKRGDLAEIEERYGVNVEVIPEGENEGAKMRVSSSGPRPLTAPRFEPLLIEEDLDLVIEEEDDEDEEEAEFRDEEDNQDQRRKRRRRRGGRNRKRRDQDGEGEQADNGHEAFESGSDEDASDSSEADEPTGDHEHGDDSAEGEERAKRRRRRGGRRRKKRTDGEESIEGSDGSDDESVADEGSSDRSEDAPAPADVAQADAVQADDVTPEPEAAPAPKPRRTRRKKVEAEAPAESDVAEEAPVVTAEPPAAVVEAEAEAAPAKPKRTRRKKAEPVAEDVADAPAEPAETAEVVVEEVPAKPKRTRRKKADTPAPEATVEAPAEVVAETVPATTETAELVAEPVAQTDAGEAPAEAGEETPSTPRRGWWQRTFGE